MWFSETINRATETGVDENRLDQWGKAPISEYFKLRLRRDKRMRMLVSVEFADAGTKSGTHRVPTIGRSPGARAAGDIGLGLEEAETLMSAIQRHFFVRSGDGDCGEAAPRHLSSQRMVDSIDQRIAISRRQTGEPA
jgi:hypothetical protein